MTDLDRLEELAKAATPTYNVFSDQTGAVARRQNAANIAYIAAASPDVVLDLIARARQGERVEKAVSRIEAEMSVALVDTTADIAYDMVEIWFERLRAALTGAEE